jgi:N-acetylneuraminic acid mutarotase
MYFFSRECRSIEGKPRSLAASVSRLLFLGSPVLAMTLICPAAGAQANEWTWMGGSATGNQAGVYGILRTPSSTNIPGSRRYASSWIDKNGNFWLFGGDGYDSTGTEVTLDDLWEFSPSASEWTWMGGRSTVPCTPASCLGISGVYGAPGVPAPGNFPGSRTGATSWTDRDGNLWLFGGDGVDGGGTGAFLNDVWEFSPTTGQWAWMGGSDIATCVLGIGGYCGTAGVYGTPGKSDLGNVPGGRFGAVGWTDIDGNLWLFGGETLVEAGADTLLNDLWEFSPSTNEWVWMGGTAAAPCPSGVSCTGVSGVYGTLGVPAPGNTPGGRYFPSTWTDSNGNFWLFGGEGMVADGGNILNDLWEFNPATGQWAWMGGSDTLFQAGGEPGVYGSIGVPAVTNIPGSRWWATSWTDSSSNLWLMGGWGYDAKGKTGYLNDLWMFSPASNQWTWVSGSSTLSCVPNADPGLPPVCGGSGVYGTLGEPSTQNVPASRGLAVGWPDAKGSLWLFGGMGEVAGGGNGHLNDVWNFRLPASRPAQRIAFAPIKKSVTYGVSSLELSASTSSGLPATFKVFLGPAKVSGNRLTVTGAGSVVVAADQAGNNSFAPAPEVRQTIVVDEALLTVTAANLAKTFGARHPAFTYSISGFVGNDTQAKVVKGDPAISTAANLGSPVGAYPIVIAKGTLSAANYAFRFVPGTLRVVRAPLAVKAGNLTMKLGGKVPRLTYAMTGFVDGETQATATAGQPKLGTTATSKSEPGPYPIRVTAGALTAKNYDFTYVDGTLTVVR